MSTATMIETHPEFEASYTNEGRGFCCVAPLEYPSPWFSNPQHKGKAYPGDCWLEFASYGEVEAHRAEAHPEWYEVQIDLRYRKANPTTLLVGRSVDELFPIEDEEPERPSGPAGGSRDSGPTAKQLAYIASLATQKGVEAPEPKTAKAAGIEIDKLLALPDVAGLRPNRFAGKCTECNNTVPEGEGFVRNIGGKWLTAHKPNQCPESPVLPEIDDGFYAVFADDGNVSFYSVKAGRKPGVLFIDLLLGGGAGGTLTRSSVPDQNRVAVLLRIAADPQAAALRFRQEAGRCVRCGRGLSNETSREEMMGPECRRK